MAGPAALFVHGAGGGGWEWAIWARVFAAAGFRVSAPDLSPVAAGLAATGFDDYRAQVGEALSALAAGPSPRVLIGASLGGLLALCHGDRVDGLVLVNPLPPAPWHERLPAAAGALARPAADGIVSWGRDARLDSTRAAMPDADDAACLWAFRRWRDESRAVLDATRAGVAVPAPRGPVLVLASELDEDVPAASSQQLATDLGADCQRLPGASHVGPLLGRNAAAVAQSAVAWLNARGIGA